MIPHPAAPPTGSSPERAAQVQRMFTNIAPRYDLMNRLMTGGQDVAWRRELIGRARLFPGARLLDLGAGTGDLGREAVRQVPGVQVLEADFTLHMMQVGQANPANPPDMAWSAADALRLPFPDQAFDAVVSGFLLRNVIDVAQALSEMRRVLRPGGVCLALDTTPPPANLLGPFIRFHLHTIIPTLGKWLAGQSDAYQYLPASTEGFLQPEQLAARMALAGFTQVGFVRRMFGTVAIHFGTRGSRD
jgi:demethylmenaquinone methyltransferase/2-methoxy-6-polyprenyl-1,4-benzoquinol methylase